MKIENLKLTNLRNDEHFQFQTEFKELVETYTVETLGIEDAFAVYLVVYINESQALDVVRKSAVTDDIAQADGLRDNTYRGLSDTVKGAANHFKPEKREAAERLMLLLGHFGNINAKSYDAQTASISALVNDLNTGYAADVATLKLEDWVAELQSNNAAFEALMDERYKDSSERTELKMKDVRTEIDAEYRTIAERIDALSVVNGPETYAPFVNELNARIERYNNTIAQRQGRNAKNNG